MGLAKSQTEDHRHGFDEQSHKLRRNQTHLVPLLAPFATQKKNDKAAQANIAAIGTGLYSRPITTMPESVMCHPRARSASRS